MIIVKPPMPKTWRMAAEVKIAVKPRVYKTYQMALKAEITNMSDVWPDCFYRFWLGDWK